MCVEVKGCDVSRNREGIWIYGYDPPSYSREGPFKQASTAMHSLKIHLDKRSVVEAKKKLFMSCVVFTEIDFSEQSIEWNPWEIINRNDIASKGLVQSLIDIFEAEHRSISAQKRDGKSAAGWYDAVASRPSTGDVDRFLHCLRPDFGYTGAAEESVRRAERMIAGFTEDQVGAAMGASGNPRVIFEGAAGTGKTYIAMHLARNWAEQGLRVGLICFNRRLGRWLTREMGSSLHGGFSGTFHSLLLNIAGIRVDGNTAPEFWRNLPGKVRDQLIDSDSKPKFDALVIDEAQDLLIDDDIDVLDLLLEGGLAGGRWAVMGDFERQAIYAQDSNAETLINRLRRRGVETAVYRLHTNCRNAMRVAANISILGGLYPGYPRTLNASIPGNVQPHFYNGSEGSVTELKKILTGLLKTYQPEQIVVLSPLSDSSSASLLSEQEPRLDIIPLPQDGAVRGRIGFCTIHSFKGMEAPVIVLTDIKGWDDNHSESLFYIGISRAKIEVHLVLEESLRSEYIRRVRA
jgi:hypothetical protein